MSLPSKPTGSGVRRTSALVGRLLAAVGTPALAQNSFTGTARSVDGDSLYVGAKEVRVEFGDGNSVTEFGDSALNSCAQ